MAHFGAERQDRRSISSRLRRNRLAGLGRFVTQRQQCSLGFCFVIGFWLNKDRLARWRCALPVFQAVAHFNHQTLGGFFTNARNFHQTADVGACHAAQKFIAIHTRQNADTEPGANAINAD